MSTIETIFAVYRFDVDKGGYGLTDVIPPELLLHTTDEEKHTIAAWVRSAISKIQEVDSSSAEWRRKRYGGLLLALEAETLSDAEYLRIGRETKRIHEVVNRLLERGRADEAIEDTMKNTVKPRSG